MVKRSDEIVWKEYTIKSLQVELKSEGRNLTEKTIKQKVREGEFGVYECLDGLKSFLLKSNAVDSYLNPPIKVKKRKKDKIKHILRPKYSEDEARKLAERKINNEIESGSSWIRAMDKDFEEEKIKRTDNYMQMKLQEVIVAIIDEKALLENAKEIKELPQDTLNYINTRYSNKSERDFFINRYFGYLNKYESLEIEDPIADMVLRNAIDDELKINYLRWLANRLPTEDSVTSALDSAIKRWNDMISNRLLLLRKGQAPPPIKPKDDDEEEEHELYSDEEIG